jgi:hypothetical protein
MAPDDSDQKFIHSDLETTRTEGISSVQISIYRSEDSDWFLELIAGDGNSTVWPEAFETEEAALGEAILVIKDEGIASFYGKAPNSQAK